MDEQDDRESLELKSQRGMVERASDSKPLRKEKGKNPKLNGAAGALQVSRVNTFEEERVCPPLLFLKGDPEPKGANFKMTDLSVVCPSPMKRTPRIIMNSLSSRKGRKTRAPACLNTGYMNCLGFYKAFS